jgi:RHS repeat-associated protein
VSVYSRGNGLAAWTNDAMPVAMLTGASGGTINPISPDWLNSPDIIANSSKQDIWIWQHDPFGTNAPNGNPYGVGATTYNPRFAGQYNDFESGLNYNRARIYNQGNGRYNQSDLLGLFGGMTGGYSTYPYVGSNPLTRIDPFGLVNIDFENPDDPAYEGSNAWNPPDWFTFAGHGNEHDPNYISSVGIDGEKRGLTPTYYSVAYVGDAILAQWDKKMPIYALVCDANDSGFDANLAQYLANQIDKSVTVYGGNGIVTTHVTEWPIFGGPMSPPTFTPDPSDWPPQTRSPQSPLCRLFGRC